MPPICHRYAADMPPICRIPRLRKICMLSELFFSRQGSTSLQFRKSAKFYWNFSVLLQARPHRLMNFRKACVFRKNIIISKDFSNDFFQRTFQKTFQKTFLKNFFPKTVFQRLFSKDFFQKSFFKRVFSKDFFKRLYFELLCERAPIFVHCMFLNSICLFLLLFLFRKNRFWNFVLFKLFSILIIVFQYFS